MESAGVFKLIFSSSATVYGEAVDSPIPEDAPVGFTKNPYGTSKYFIERILMDLSSSKKLLLFTRSKSSVIQILVYKGYNSKFLTTRAPD